MIFLAAPNQKLHFGRLTDGRPFGLLNHAFFLASISAFAFFLFIDKTTHFETFSEWESRAVYEEMKKWATLKCLERGLLSYGLKSSTFWFEMASILP